MKVTSVTFSMPPAAAGVIARIVVPNWLNCWKPGRRMKHVLYAVDDRRMLGILGHLDKAFEAKQVGTAMVGEGLEKERQRHGVQGGVAL